MPRVVTSRSPLVHGDAPRRTRTRGAHIAISPPGVLHHAALDVSRVPVDRLQLRTLYRWSAPLLELAKRFEVQFVICSNAFDRYFSYAPDALKPLIEARPGPHFQPDEQARPHPSGVGLQQLRAYAEAHDIEPRRLLLIECRPARMTAPFRAVACPPDLGLSDLQTQVQVERWLDEFSTERHTWENAQNDRTD